MNNSLVFFLFFFFVTDCSYNVVNSVNHVKKSGRYLTVLFVCLLPVKVRTFQFSTNIQLL